MPVDIRILDRTKLDEVNPPKVTAFRLRSQGKAWMVPEVVLASYRSLAHLRSVEIKVTGPSPVAERIQGRYFAKTFDPPRQLREPISFGGILVENAGPLPAKVKCELTVTITYRDSDGQGNPVGGDLTATLPPVKLFTEDNGPEPAELVVRPETTVTLGKPTRLVIEVRNPGTETPPTVRLEHPETVLAPDNALATRLAPVLAELRDALVRALQVTSNRTDRADGVDTYAVPLTVRRDQPTAKILAEIADPVLVPVVVEQKGCPRSANALLRLEAEQAQFAGWVVIDFGTTNSTVTVSEVRAELDPEGLPTEQEQVVRQKMAKLVRTQAQELFPGGRRFEDAWRRLLTQVAERVGLGGADALAADIDRFPADRFYEVLAAFEIALQAAEPADFRRGLVKRLHDLTHAALIEPTLSRDYAYPVRLDQTRNAFVVASEMEVLAVEPFGDKGDLMVRARMGKEVHDAKLQKIYESADDSADQVISRFIPAVKRHFGTDREPFKVTLDGQDRPLSVEQLMRAGWKALLEMTEQVQAQDPDFRSKGAFRKVIVTYPTVAPPSVRRRIPELLKDLKLDDVLTDYDEAIAAAIFYMLREYTGFAEVGLEAFKARSRIVDPSQTTWAQNVLVLDIGGGTTDIALIRLTLSEEAAFEPNEDRGAGGRFYKITPKLLSSTGNTRLGGELMTLRVFRMLKGLLADRILQLVQDGKLKLDPVKTLLATGLPFQAKEKGGYKVRDKGEPGWLLDAIDRDKPETQNKGEFYMALDLADRVLPTRWLRAGAQRLPRLQAFYSIWELAEEAKRRLGSPRPADGDDGGPRPADGGADHRKSGAGRPGAAKRADESDDPDPRSEEFCVRPEKVLEVLAQCYPGVELPSADAAKDLMVVMNVDQLERAIRPVVDEAVKYAAGALEQLPPGDKVDWLILSGQSCHLNLVRQEIRQKFQAHDRFIWNPERVTFVPRYAKLSTSIGACLAEHLRCRVQAPQQSKTTLRRGVNLLRFDIDNLFHNLPCTFNIAIQQTSERVLTVGTELTELTATPPGEEPRGKARSEWIGVLTSNTLKRKDFEGAHPIPWGTYNAGTLIKNLGLHQKDWEQNYRQQFEIDHKLNVEILLSRFAPGYAQPDYVVTNDERKEPSLDVKAELAKLAARVAAQIAAKAPAGSAAPADPLPPLFAEANGVKSFQWRIGLYDVVGKVVQVVLFDPAAPRRARFHLPDRVKTGWLSTATVDHRPDMKAVRLALTHPGIKYVLPLPELPLPDSTPQFRRNCRFSLDEDGMLRVHTGEPGYWESNDPHVLVTEPGRVYRTTLPLEPPEPDEEINPFSGLH